MIILFNIINPYNFRKGRVMLELDLMLIVRIKSKSHNGRNYEARRNILNKLSLQFNFGRS